MFHAAIRNCNAVHDKPGKTNKKKYTCTYYFYRVMTNKEWQENILYKGKGLLNLYCNFYHINHEAGIYHTVKVKADKGNIALYIYIFESETERILVWKWDLAGQLSPPDLFPAVFYTGISCNKQSVSERTA